MIRKRKQLTALLLVVLMLATTLLSHTFAADAITLSTAFSQTLEAENAVMAGNVKASTTRAGYSGTGYATGFNQASNNSWSMQLTIPASQHYTITVRTAADSYKENFLLIDGSSVAPLPSPLRKAGDGSTWIISRLRMVQAFRLAFIPTQPLIW
ncbi:MAG: glycoside hydrolase family 26 [Anaerocolumna sp.]|nr:glycoside hydrolase family 26 [Anaerocolumna sp.]